MDAKLNNALNKIIQLCNQNAEFDKELRRRLHITSPANALSLDNARIEKIEKYLGLDYGVDSIKSTIDYSFVKMDDVRDQLISDYREMMRFRYGTRYHKIDFDEFCRYAHLQAEMLLNYYYDVMNHSNLEAIKRHIKEHNKDAYLDKAKNLGSIPYATKLWAFKEEFKIDYLLNITLQDIKDVRNKLSHRTTKIKEELDIKRYQDELKMKGIALQNAGWVDNKALKENPAAKKTFENEIKYTQEYKQYNIMLWYSSEPFEKIINSIDDLSKIISRALKQEAKT